MPLGSHGESLINSKQKNQIAARFESALCWWSTSNKNVDWINNIYYNRDIGKGTAKQLGPTSNMA
jgi:hypothetical protein